MTETNDREALTAAVGMFIGPSDPMHAPLVDYLAGQGFTRPREANPHVVECSGGDEVGVDWANGIVLHEGDDGWHPWDEEVYGPRPATQHDPHARLAPELSELLQSLDEDGENDNYRKEDAARDIRAALARACGCDHRNVGVHARRCPSRLPATPHEVTASEPAVHEVTSAEVENQGRAEAERRGYPLPDGEADDQSGWTFVEGVHYGFALRAAR